MTGHSIRYSLKKICIQLMIIFSRAIYISAESHTLCFSYGCFDSSDTQLCLTLDGDELCYTDFKKNTVVWDTKVKTDTSVWAWEYALIVQGACKRDIHRWKPDTSVTRAKDAPETLLYPRDEVIKDEDNTLICFSNNFFPPKITIKWTKNNEEVAEEDPFIKTIPNPDGTFHVFSFLNFVPKQGDIYSCTVEHETLEEPQTRFWDVETEDSAVQTSSGPAVFCGLGLSLGLLGVVAATFLFVKGNQYHCMQDSAR